MGREIRRVPPNWEHPKKMFNRYERGVYKEVEDYQPMYDQPFAEVMEDWYAGWKAWNPAEHDGAQYWEDEGSPPDPVYYRPAWPEGVATWWQVYQTVSEGSPVTPPFATPEELIDYLATNGDFWDQRRGDGAWERKNAESFVKVGWAPSMIGFAGALHAPRDGSFSTSTGDPDVR